MRTGVFKFLPEHCLSATTLWKKEASEALVTLLARMLTLLKEVSLMRRNTAVTPLERSKTPRRLFKE
jgi:hypothetical protein